MSSWTIPNSPYRRRAQPHRYVTHNAYMLAAIANITSVLQPQRERIRLDFEHQLSENAIELERLAPNLKAYEKLDEMSGKLSSAQHGYDRVAKEHHDAQAAFDAVRQRRTDLFLEAYEHISHEIEVIYSQLTKSPEFPTGMCAVTQCYTVVAR